MQAVEAEERRLAWEREEAERQRHWEAAVERAKRRLATDHRLEVLRNRVRSWEEAQAIRAYCDAVEARYGADTVAADPEPRSGSSLRANTRTRPNSCHTCHRILRSLRNASSPTSADGA